MDSGRTSNRSVGRDLSDDGIGEYMKILLLIGRSHRDPYCGLPVCATTQSRTRNHRQRRLISKRFHQVRPNRRSQKPILSLLTCEHPRNTRADTLTRAINIPLDRISRESGSDLKKDEPIYLICQTGNRSKKAAIILNEAGFKNVINITGGTSAWEAANLPMDMPPPHSTKTDEGAD